MTRRIALLGSALAALATARCPAQSESFLGDVLNLKDSTTAVYAATNSDYTRERLPDGTLKPETYALESGGCIESAVRDPTLDGIGVRDIARSLVGPMRRHGYVPAREPMEAKLVVVVYWGVTSGAVPGNMDVSMPPFSPFDAPAQNAPASSGPVWHDTGFTGTASSSWIAYPRLSDDEAERHNAALLGYALDLSETASSGLIHNIRRDDLLADIRESRYFVILLAYDLQLLSRQKVRKMLWEARYSLRERGNDFSAMLPRMTAYASQYFGQNTRGLIRNVLPEGHVEIGEAKVVADASSKEPAIPEVALFAGSPSLTGRQPQPAQRPIPADLAQRIDAYNRDSANLRDRLAATISVLPPGNDVRRAIDAFNAEHSAVISKLGSEAQRIRMDLARANPGPSGPRQETLDSLVRQFAQGVGGAGYGNGGNGGGGSRTGTGPVVH
ncbi:MAG TPA: hypothetical protein VGG34_15445 [Opitutaceae bacterium]|jgi:hypothetical protein